MNEEIKIKNDKKKNRIAKDRVKKSNGFNILDALIIIGVLALVAIIVLVYSPAGFLKIRSDSSKIIYSMCISGVNADFAGSVKVGDAVTDSKGYKLGVVASDVEIEPHSVYEYRENEDGSGSIVKVTHPELVDLVITISADAIINDDGYTVDGKRISLETEYKLVFPGFESNGICISLSVEEPNEAGE